MASADFPFSSVAVAGEGALRYWTRLRGLFNHIDAAIEAAYPSVSRDKFRRQRVRIVEMICADEDENDGREAEGFREILDEFMEESLVSLQYVPADAVPRVMASCPDLLNAVDALQSHGSECVRGLARDVIRGWRASVDDDIVVKIAAVAALDAALLETPPSESRAISHISDGSSNSNPKAKKDHRPSIREDKKAASLVVRVARANKTEGAPGPTKTTPAAGISRAAMGDKQAPLKKLPEFMPKKQSTASNVTNGLRDDNATLKHQAKIQENRPLTQKTASVVVGPGRAKPSEASPMPKKTTPAAVSFRQGVRTVNTVASSTKIIPSPEEMKMMEYTNRRLREVYQEEADAKRQRRIQVIEAPKMPEPHKQRKIHPIMRERSRERFGSSTAVKRSLISFDRV